jgi:FtsZ-interacting cell division protein YlmF
LSKIYLKDEPAGELSDRSPNPQNNDPGLSAGIKIIKPETSDDSNKVMDEINKNNSVVLNCEETEKEIIKYIIDTVTAEITDANVTQIAYKTYVIAPANIIVQVEKDQLIIVKGFLRRRKNIF